MGQQYLREVSVKVGGIVITSDGDNGPRIRFETQQFTSSTPAHANILITNLSNHTYNALAKENLKVVLSAGYRDGGTSVIYSGETRQVRLFREEISDLITHLLVTTSGNARNYAVVNKSLAAGHSHDDRVQEAIRMMKPYGITIGTVDKLGGPKFPRGCSLFGMASDMLRETCMARQAQWFNHNGTFHLLKNENTLSGGTIVLNSNSGLVGIPEQTLQGVHFRALLNPAIIPGCKVQINQKSVTRAAFDPSTQGAGNNELLKDGSLMGVQADGQYKVLKVSHSGDTRGNGFYTDGWCVGLDSDSLALRSIGISDDIPN